MKKIYLPIALLVAAMLFAGCTLGGGGPAPTGKDCGTDASCLVAAIENCEQAYGTESIGDDNMRMTQYVQVVGGTKSSCQYYIKIDKVELSADVPAAQKAMVEQLLSGKDMTCTMPSTGSNLGEAIEQDHCTGSLVTGWKMLFMAATHLPDGTGNDGYSGDGGSSGGNDYGGYGGYGGGYY